MVPFRQRSCVRILGESALSRIDVAEFVASVLRELPDLPKSSRTAIAKAALEPESRRVAAIRKVLEESLNEEAEPNREPSGG